MRATAPLVLRSPVLLVALLIGCATEPAQPQARWSEPVSWQALSTTALGITGNITLSDQALTFANDAQLKLQLVQYDAPNGVSLYKVLNQTNPKLLNDNLFCGEQPVDYMTAATSEGPGGQSDLQITAYYYPESLRLSDLPLKDKDDLTRSMCAIYNYVSASG